MVFYRIVLYFAQVKQDIWKIMNKILVIQLRQLGDVIMTTPVVRQLRKLYPAAQIDFLTEKLGANVYRFNSSVSNVITISRKPGTIELLKLIFRLRKEKYDLLIDCFSNPKSAQLTFLSGANQRTGFNFRGRTYAYTSSVKIAEPLEYAAVSKLRLIPHPAAELADCKIELPVDADHNRKAADFAAEHNFGTRTIAFCTVSRRDYKVWHPDNLAKTGDWLISKGYKLWFIYGPGEKEMALEVYNRLQNKSDVLIDYKMPDVVELRAMLEKCCLYVGNDGGNKHLAICAGIPTVTVFGSIRWQNWTPPGSPTDHVVYKEMDCYDRCLKCHDMRCYKELTEQDLIAKLETVLKTK